MKLNVYTVFDEKAEAFMSPFFMGTDAIAIRGFSDAVNNDSNEIGKHPEDYTLFVIGEWSDTKGEITPIERRMIGNGVQYKTQE